MVYAVHAYQDICISLDHTYLAMQVLLFGLIVHYYLISRL